MSSLQEQSFTARLAGVKLSSWVATLILIVALPFILLGISGFNPLSIFGNLISGSVGSLTVICRSLEKATPLILVGLGATVAFRCSVWNIGIQGQMLLGGLGATIGGLYVVGGVPRPVNYIIMFVLAAIFGGVWALIPGFLRQRFRVNELVSSLLLNYIAYFLIVYLVRYPMLGDKAFGSTTNNIDKEAWLFSFWSSGPLSALKIGFPVAVAIGLVLWYFFRRSVFGYWIRAVGTNASASFVAGIPVTRLILIVMFMSGALAGLSGLSEVAGTYHVLSEGIGINYGFFGVAAALLGRMRPLPVLFVGIGMGCLLTGGLAVQAATGVSQTLVLVIIACFLVGVLFQPSIERAIIRGSRRFVRPTAQQLSDGRMAVSEAGEE